MASQNLEMYRTFALSSTPSLRWHGPLVQTAPQTSSISAGWTLSAKQALGWGWEVAIHPADLPRILETFRDALNSVKPYEVEGRFRRFDGEFR
jgi:PAS fold